MHIKNLNKNHFYRFFLKIPLSIFFVSYIRFLYFVYVKKNLKTLYSNDNIPDKMAQNKSTHRGGSQRPRHLAVAPNTTSSRAEFNCIDAIAM